MSDVSQQVDPAVILAGGPSQRNQLAAHVWPQTAALVDGSITVGGVDVADLVAEHGTPSFVVDEAHFRARARLFVDSFNEAFGAIGTGVDVYYAGKSFLSVAIAKWVIEEGMRLDTCTGGEMAVAERAGVVGADMGLHGSRNNACNQHWSWPNCG